MRSPLAIDGVLFSPATKSDCNYRNPLEITASALEGERDRLRGTEGSDDGEIEWEQMNSTEWERERKADRCYQTWPDRTSEYRDSYQIRSAHIRVNTARQREALRGRERYREAIEGYQIPCAPLLVDISLFLWTWALKYLERKEREKTREGERFICWRSDCRPWCWKSRGVVLWMRAKHLAACQPLVSTLAMCSQRDSKQPLKQIHSDTLNS